MMNSSWHQGIEDIHYLASLMAHCKGLARRDHSPTLRFHCFLPEGLPAGEAIAKGLPVVTVIGIASLPSLRCTVRSAS